MFLDNYDCLGSLSENYGNPKYYPSIWAADANIDVAYSIKQ